MHVGKEGWPVWSDRTDATAAQMAVKDDAGSDRTMSVPCSWLCMELSQRPVRVPKRIPIHCQKCQQWAREHQNWTTKQWKKVAWSDESHFVLPHVDGRLHIHRLTGEHLTPGCTMRSSQWRWCDALCNDLLGNFGSCHLCECYFDMYHLDKQIWSVEPPPLSLQDSKDLLVTSWSQIPQRTFRALLESLLWLAKAILAGNHNVLPDRCISSTNQQTERCRKVGLE